MGSDVLALPKVYCISLARAAGRRRRMVERLDKLGADYEMVDAVDGSTYDLSSLGARLRQDVARRRWARDLTRSEIGCYLSHYNLWQRFADEGVRSAIVVEDDSGFTEDFLSVTEAANRIPYDWDVIILHTQKKKTKSAKTLCTVGGNSHRIIRCDVEIAGTGGYLISASGIRQLLSHCFEICDPIDYAYSRYWISGIKYYAVHPKIVFDDDSETLIPLSKGAYSPSIVQRISRTIWRRKQKIAVKFYNRRNPLPQSRSGEYRYG